MAERETFRLEGPAGYAPGWFTLGRLRVLTGTAAGLSGVVRSDVLTGNGREIRLWQALGAAAEPGDKVQLEAGCDKSADTCKAKFANFLRFRGYPHIPGADWLISYPVSGGDNGGGKLV